MRKCSRRLGSNSAYSSTWRQEGAAAGSVVKAGERRGLAAGGGRGRPVERGAQPVGVRARCAPGDKLIN